MKTVLVTGGNGAVGFNLVGELKKASKVIVVDNLSSGSQKCVHSGVSYFYFDIRDSEKLEQIYLGEDIHSVYHLAANFANQSSVDFPFLDLDVNGRGILNLLSLSKKYNVSRFVYTSSSCVFGGQSGSLSEKSPIRLDTPYAITKYLGENYCEYFASMSDMSIDVYRLFNSYGPGEFNGKYRNVMPNFIYRSLYNDDLIITGTGEESRDFTYVGDIVSALLLEGSKGYNVFNVGFGSSTKIYDLASAIISETDSESKILFTDRRKWDHVFTRLSDTSKIRNERGWQPKVNLQEGLKLYVNWFKGIL
jgi:UDP-glucose 4-epimerase